MLAQHMKCMYLYTNTCLNFFRHGFDLFRRPLLSELDSKRGCTSCLSWQRKNCQISGYDPWKNERLRWQSVSWRASSFFGGGEFFDAGYYTDSALAAHKYEAHGLIAKEGLQGGHFGTNSEFCKSTRNLVRTSY